VVGLQGYTMLTKRISKRCFHGCLMVCGLIGNKWFSPAQLFFSFHLFLNLSLSHTLSISHWSFSIQIPKRIQELKKALYAVPQLSSHPKPGCLGSKRPDYINFWPLLQFCLWIFGIWTKILTWYSCLISLFVRPDPLRFQQLIYQSLKLEFDCLSVLILYSYINSFHSALGSMVWSIEKSLFLINKTRKNKETNDIGKLIRKKD
jgi:hypothetical protein